jgi:hypothetical protein
VGFDTETHRPRNGGALVGQKMHAIDTITTYYPAPLPGEAFGITAPEGAAEVTIKTKY